MCGSDHSVCLCTMVLHYMAYGSLNCIITHFEKKILNCNFSITILPLNIFEIFFGFAIILVEVTFTDTMFATWNILPFVATNTIMLIVLKANECWFFIELQSISCLHAINPGKTGPPASWCVFVSRARVSNFIRTLKSVNYSAHTHTPPASRLWHHALKVSRTLPNAVIYGVFTICTGV